MQLFKLPAEQRTVVLTQVGPLEGLPTCPEERGAEANLADASSLAVHNHWQISWHFRGSSVNRGQVFYPILHIRTQNFKVGVRIPDCRGQKPDFP